MTRKEKIDAIVKTITDSINTHRAVQNWMEEVLIYDRIGLDSMTNEEIDEEYEIWCEDDDEAV